MNDLKLSHQMAQPGPPKVITFRIGGEASANNCMQAEQYFDKVLQTDQPDHVLLDLTALTFAGSAFFSSLLFWREEMTKRKGQLVLFGLRSEIASIMRILTLDRVLTVQRDQQTALDALPGAT